MMKKIASLLLFTWVSLFAWGALAQETPPPADMASTLAADSKAAPSPAAPEQQDKSLDYLAIALSIGLAALGGAIGQGLVGFGAMSGVARNPGSKSTVQTMMILVLVLIESIVIYALVISLLLYAKL